MSTWQEIILGNLPPGTRKTSGYRTPAQERALGGPPTSYHSRGTVKEPGAIDIGGPADKLKQLFDQIKEVFKGRINELYLNLPQGTSEAIRHNQPISGNPEKGRPQHLHIALGEAQTFTGRVQPAEGIPALNRGEKALEAAPADVCARRLCPPDIAGMIQGAMGKEAAPQTNCICYSDLWIYGTGLFLVVGGSWLVFRGAGK